MSYTWVSIVIIMIIIVIVVPAVVADVGVRTVQSAEQLGYEREDQRTVIRFSRPLPALAIIEPPISGY
jgi:hypothetical protein